MTRAIDRIDHPALRNTGSRERGEKAWAVGGLAMSVPTDVERIAIVLQAAGLLSHLSRAGWSLRSDWSEGWRDSTGYLRGLVALPKELRSETAVDVDKPKDDFGQAQLRDLVRVLFRTKGGVSGRGAGRVAARALLAAWDQDLRVVSADEAIGHIFTSAEFLWDDPFVSQRETLTTRVHEVGKSSELWAAGPGWVQRRLSGRGLSSESVEVAGWVNEAAPAPSPLDALGDCPRAWGAQAVPRGGWVREARRWIGRVGLSATEQLSTAERIEGARALAAVGRARSALKLLGDVEVEEAEELRISSLYRLGDLGAAEARLRRAVPQAMRFSTRLRMADVALRVLANRGRAEEGERWLKGFGLGQRARLLSVDVALGLARTARDLLWAASFWDRGDLEKMEKALRRASGAVEIPAYRWRWFQLDGLCSLSRGDTLAAKGKLEKALASSRRRLRPTDAAALWNDLMLCRAGLEDLHGAERACLHGLRLLRDAEGGRQSTLFLFNLAEIRLRRGVLCGVEEIVERATRANRNARNSRGAGHDAALWARLELLRGEPRAALERIRSVPESARRWNQNELAVLAARALGWLGRAEEALAELREVRPEPVLDPEEVPALWYLAGDPVRARESASGVAAELWRELIDAKRDRSGPVDRDLDDWASLGRLPDHRAARMALDIERISPGSVPGPVLLRSAESFRRLSGRGFADELERAAGGVWAELASYFDRLANGATSSPGDRHQALECLSRRVGCAPSFLDSVAVFSQASVRGDAAGERHLRGIELGSRERVLLGLARLNRSHRSGPEGAASGGEGRGAARRAAHRGGDAGVHQTVSIIGESPALRQALDRIDRLALSDLSVLIRGETGTGKELFARRVHAQSSRRREPFLPVNCAALSESLLLSELFGHVRGAFTGADRDREGVFEAARGGTVFLDEIGDLPSPAQGALLRVLQEGEVRRVGESRARPVAARVVAATHRDLEALAQSRRFRSDLFYRLRVGFVSLPPLRDRNGDIELLAEHFLDRRRLTLSRAVGQRLRDHTWPGNVRELENVVEAAAVLVGAGNELTVEALDLPEPETLGLRNSYHEQVNDFRRDLIREAVVRHGGNRSRAAADLGLSRQAMSYLVRKLHVSA